MKIRSGLAAAWVVLKRSSSWIFGVLPSWAQASLRYVFGKYWDHAVGVVVGSTAVYLWTVFFPAAVDTYFVQSGLGEHCPIQLFDEAARRGIALSFQPPALRHVAVCGPGNHEGRTISERLLDYLTKRQASCFVTAVSGSSVTVQPNLEGQSHGGVSGRARLVDIAPGQQAVVCRCDPRQVPLLMEREMVCGAQRKLR